MTDELFIKLYEQHKNSVYSVIFGYVRSEADAADLTQETFIKLYSCGKDFESSEHIKAWLLRCAINSCKNHLRDIKKHGHEELDENIPAAPETDYGDVMQAVLELPEKYRVVIHLFYYENYSVKQIAQALDVSENTAKTMLARGRDKLKSRLEKEAEHYEYRFGI